MALSFLLPGRPGAPSTAEALLTYFSRTGQRRYLAQLIAQCGDRICITSCSNNLMQKWQKKFASKVGLK
ncbi:hypothetical protein [Alishewanella longhuensis]